MISFLHCLWHSTMELHIDWAALATFCAVIVALYPIYKDYQRNRAIAVALRVRIRVELEALRVMLDPSPMNDYKDNPVPKLRESIEILKLLFMQSYLLEAEEYDALVILFAQMMRASRSDTIDSAEKTLLFVLLESTLRTLRKFKSFRSKYQGLKPPELEK